MRANVDIRMLETAQLVHHKIARALIKRAQVHLQAATLCSDSSDINIDDELAKVQQHIRRDRGRK
jgi:hypothetical protein